MSQIMNHSVDELESIERYTEAILATPDPYSYFKRGKLYNKMGNREKALADFDMAIHLKPNFKATYYNRANLHIRNKAYLLAIEDYTKVVELLSSNLPENVLNEPLAKVYSGN